MILCDRHLSFFISHWLLVETQGTSRLYFLGLFTFRNKVRLISADLLNFTQNLVTKLLSYTTLNLLVNGEGTKSSLREGED